jgi:ribonucleoside-triphosphate reductase
MDVINIAFMQVMEEGDADGHIHSFPIPTYNITSDFDWDSEVTNKLFAMTAKYGTPYFANYINSDMQPSDTRSMCCRLRLDLRELRKRNGGFFGAGDLTGSIGVVTINMPKIGYMAKNKSDYFRKLDRLLILAKESLDIKREKCNEMLNIGMLPYMKRYLKNGFNNHFSTIGIVGMNESCLNFLNTGIYSPEGNTFANEVLDYINKRLSDFQEQSELGILYNLEATPAEGTSYRLAKHDKENFVDIITAGTEEVPYYTNSVHLPVGYTNDIDEALKLEDKMQTKFTSGTVIHIFIGEQIDDPNIVKQIVKKIFTNYELPYISIAPTFSTCIEHGYIKGEHFNCPICDKPSLVWSRVVGYYRPVQNWNNGKRQEFLERKYYNTEV